MSVMNLANISLLAGCKYYADMTGGDQVIITASTCIYVGSTGDVKVDFENGETVTFSGVPTGQVLALKKITKIYETGTSATKLVIGYIE